MAVLLVLLSAVAALLLLGGHTLARPPLEVGNDDVSSEVGVVPPLQSLSVLQPGFLDTAKVDIHLGDGLVNSPHPDLTLAFTGTQEHFNTRLSPTLSGNYDENLQTDDKDYILHHRQRRQTTADELAATAEDIDPDSDMYLEDEQATTDPSASDATQNLDPKEKDTVVMGQHFFPSFAPLFPAPPPLGHSRPQLLFQEPSQRPSILRAQHNSFQPLNFGGGSFRSNPFVQQTPAPAETNSNSGILGSGNFGVIRGGTFYNDGEKAEASSDYGGGESHHVYNPYYNGHGRPAFYNGASNPRPQHHRGNDFFSNFRDFADINTPTKSSFSEFYVVYVNKNATREDGESGKLLVPGSVRPKNIIEQLNMLDEENVADDKRVTSINKSAEDETKSKKGSKVISLSKQKLSLLRQDKYNKQSNKVKTTTSAVPKDLYEPLLALS